jgi:arsenate reductase
MFTIYHNPRCSKSRQTLSLLEEHGIEPKIVLYLDNPPSTSQMGALLKKLDLSARDLLRKSEDEYKANQLDNPKLSDKHIIETMVKHPKLIERPIVVKGERAVLGRPPENVLPLLD